MTAYNRPIRILRVNRTTFYVRFLDSLCDDLVPKSAVKR